MRAVIAGLIFLALLAAGGTVFLVKRYLDARSQTAEDAEVIDGVAATLVLVADEDLPAGTLITPGALSWQRWPEAGIAEGFVVSAEEDEELKQQFIGAAVRRGIITGDADQHEHGREA